MKFEDYIKHTDLSMWGGEVGRGSQKHVCILHNFYNVCLQSMERINHKKN